MSYQHLTIEERCCIREFYNKGKSIREIANLIDRNPSTISREIRRNCNLHYIKKSYYPYTAQRKYEYRRRFCHRGMFGDEKLIEYIETKLSLTWSPEQISNYPSEFKMPSFKTIYRWLYEGYLLKGDLNVLRKKGQTRKRLGKGGRFTTGKSIRKRDRSVYKRKEIGHWEADTVVSGIGKSKACFLTLVERKTRYYIAVWMPNRKGETLENAIVKVLGNYPKELVKSITCDRGSEFAKWANIEKRLGCNMYFADPYCAWQKGSNENSNGLLREFYPKGRNLSKVSEKTLKKNLELINSRPRKVLGYQTPASLFNYELNKCCT
ncbi:MAG: IS30 family transposase [Bacteroidales bacterium]|nr:IS30 family transposase [Bacteroidales bacterium]